MIYINLWFLLLGCFKLIKDYLYYQNYFDNNDELIYENKLVGLEIEKYKDNKYETIDYILYSSDTNIKYNAEYIGKITNLSHIYLFNKDDEFYFNKIEKIIKNYKYSENILNTIDSLNEKIILNEIFLNNVYIYKGKYSDNINDIALYFSKNNIRLISVLSFAYFIEYFFSAHLWTQFNII
jgi:hypothetical protein